MSDQKPEDKEILLKQTDEEKDKFSTLQDEFDTLLSEDGKQPSVIESDQIINLDETPASELDSDLTESTQDMVEIDAPQQENSPDSTGDSTAIEPNAFAGKISSSEKAALEAMYTGATEDATSSDTPDGATEDIKPSKEESPLNEPLSFPAMQDDFDAFIHKTPGMEKSPQQDSVPTELPADIGFSSIAELTQEPTPEETPSPDQPSGFGSFKNEMSGAESSSQWDPMPKQPLSDISSENMADEMNEAASEETPPQRSSKGKWVSIFFIIFSLAAISLVLWQIVGPIISEIKVAEKKSDNIQSPQPATQTPDEETTTVEQPIQITEQQLSGANETETATNLPDNVQSPQPTPQMPAEETTAVEQASQITAKQLSDTAKTGMEETGKEQLTSVSGSIITSQANNSGTDLPKSPVQPTVRKSIQSVSDSNKGWAVNLVSEKSEGAARQQVAHYQGMGIKAEYILILAKNEPWYRIRIPGFSTEEDAIAYKDFLSEKYSISSWHNRIKEAAKHASAISFMSAGNWAVALATVDSEKTAIQQQALVRATGIEAEYIQTIESGKTGFFIQVSGFSNKQDAEKQGGILARKLNTHISWVNKL